MGGCTSLTSSATWSWAAAAPRSPPSARETTIWAAASDQRWVERVMKALNYAWTRADRYRRLMMRSRR